MTSNLRCAIQQPMNYVMRLKAGGTLGRGMQCIAFPKVQCKLIREYTWGSSLKVSGEEESKKNWKNWNLTCLLGVDPLYSVQQTPLHLHLHFYYYYY